MSVVYAAMFLVLAVAIALVFLALKKQNEDQTPKYRRIEALFTFAERSFYGVLEQAVEKRAVVLGKVRVADVISPEKGLSRKEWKIAFNRVALKHFDFILCKTEDLSVICAVELNDSSHRSQSREDRDIFLGAACKSAGIPLLQVPAKNSYTLSEVKELLAPYLVSSEMRQEIDPQPLPATPEQQQKVCPKCSSHLVKRTAKQGPNAGRQFWACSSYPKCRHIETISS